MQHNYNKHLKSNSVNKSIHISKMKNTCISFNNNIFKVPKEIFYSTHKFDFSCADYSDKKQVGVFPKIDCKNQVDMKKTTPTKFNSKSSSSKKNILYEPLRDFSYEGEEKKIHLQNKKVKPIALFSSKMNEKQFKSNNNSPRLIMNDNRSDASNDNIMPTKNIKFMNVYSNRKNDDKRSRRDSKEEGINLNHSMEMNNIKEGKSFHGDNCELNFKLKEDNTISQLKAIKMMNTSYSHNISHKSASPRYPSRTYTTKDNYLCSKKLNILKSLTNPTKIYVESIEDLHFIYNNLYRQNRELAYKLDFEEKDVEGLDVDL